MNTHPRPRAGRALAAAALAVLPGLLTADPPAAGREPYEDAVDGGLAYLARSQARDGSWTAEAGDADRPGDPALTALAVMAFLSAGHVPGDGPHGAAVGRGVRFVLAAQQPDGVFHRPDDRGVEMYGHGICTLMLAEAAGMTDDRLGADLADRLRRAVRVILRAQRTAGDDAGGWRYRVLPADEDPRTRPLADLSVTGWQLLALRAARDAGCDVPDGPIRAAVGYARRCFAPAAGGQPAGFGYVVRGRPTPACTGAGVLALELAGAAERRSAEALQAGAYLLRHPPDPRQDHFFYGAYYAAQATFRLGGNYWRQHRPVLHRALLEDQPPRRNGAWYGRGAGDPDRREWADVRYGPAYCTALAVLALAVEYRYLPIYQRDEGDGPDPG